MKKLCKFLDKFFVLGTTGKKTKTYLPRAPRGTQKFSKEDRLKFKKQQKEKELNIISIGRLKTLTLYLGNRVGEFTYQLSVPTSKGATIVFTVQNLHPGFKLDLELRSETLAALPILSEKEYKYSSDKPIRELMECVSTNDENYNILLFVENELRDFSKSVEQEIQKQKREEYLHLKKKADSKKREKKIKDTLVTGDKLLRETYSKLLDENE